MTIETAKPRRVWLSSGWAVCFAGAAAALGQAPVSLPWVTLLGLALACWAQIQAPSPRQAAWQGWLFGLGYFAAALHWIVEPFLVDAARHAWMAPFALVMMSSGLALFWALASWLARWIGPTPVPWALALALAELARSYVFTGFPWALIGHVWIGWSPVQLAAWIGPHGLTTTTLLAVALTFAFWRRRALLAGVAVALVAIYVESFVRGGQEPPASTGQVVRLVQPNAPQHEKWHPDHVETFFWRQVQATGAPGQEGRPDLIIWPETSVPTLLENAGGAFSAIKDAAAGVPVVLGIQRRDEAGAFYNSLVALDSAGDVTQVYDKHHLVPFGEYIPALDLLALLPFGALIEEHGFGYTPGPGPELVDLGPLGSVLPLICYEAVFPQDVNAAPERPDWLLQITNDAWFGDFAGPYQHLAQARLRAVEQGLPMVRVANTGVSAVIDARGRVTNFLPLNQQGFLDAALPAALPETLYARSGDWPATLVLLMLLGISLAKELRNRVDARGRAQ